MLSPVLPSVIPDLSSDLSEVAKGGSAALRARRHLLLFTKPARAGRVKTRLVGDLSAAQAAELHEAFLMDLVDRLRSGAFGLTLAWALDEGEEIPLAPAAGAAPLPGLRQQGADLGERLFAALAGAGESEETEKAEREIEVVMALGSDHPTLPVERVEDAFGRVEAGADVVLGPAEDGGYYLIALRRGAVSRRLFADIPWSTEGVMAATVERCREADLRLEVLPMAADVDTPADLRRLAAEMATGDLGCPRTRTLLVAWGLVGKKAEATDSGRGGTACAC